MKVKDVIQSLGVFYATNTNEIVWCNGINSIGGVLKPINHSSGMGTSGGTSGTPLFPPLGNRPRGGLSSTEVFEYLGVEY